MHTQSRHRLTRAPVTLKPDQLAQMSELADRHNRSFAGEVRTAIDFYIAANARRQSQQTAPSAGRA